MKHVKTSFTAALPNNMLYFISHLSLTSLRTYRPLSTTQGKIKKVSPTDIHRHSILLRRYIRATAQQGILRLLTKEFYWKVKTQTYISGNHQEVSQQTLNQNCLYTSYCSGNPQVIIYYRNITLFSYTIKQTTPGEDVLYLSRFYFHPTTAQGINQDMEQGRFCQTQYACDDVCVTNSLVPAHIIKRQFLD